MKYYTLITYKNGNVVNMISFDTVEEVNKDQLNIGEMDKIRLFKLNITEDGRDLIKEFYLNDLKDSLLHLKDTKIIGYDLESIQGHIYFIVKYEISEEVQKNQALCHKQRYISTLIKKSKFNDNTFRDGLSAALA